MKSTHFMYLSASSSVILTAYMDKTLWERNPCITINKKAHKSMIPVMAATFLLTITIKYSHLQLLVISTIQISEAEHH